MVVSRGFLFFVVNLVVVFLYVNADVSHIGEFSDLKLISLFFFIYKFILLTRVMDIGHSGTCFVNLFV